MTLLKDKIKYVNKIKSLFKDLKVIEEHLNNNFSI